MLAAREAEQPGFRAAWEADNASRKARVDATWQAEHDAHQTLASDLQRIAADLLPEHRAAFAACLEPAFTHEKHSVFLGSEPLLIIAKDYREHLKKREQSVSPGGLTGGLRIIQEKANELRLALLQAPAEVLHEIDAAGLLVSQQGGRFPVLRDALRDAVARELPVEPHQQNAPWVVRLKGLDDLTSWLAGELDGSLESKGKRTNYDTHAPDSPDARLFRSIAKLLDDVGQEEKHLRPIARVVRAWATGVTEPGVPFDWAAREPARVHRETKILHGFLKRMDRLYLQRWCRSILARLVRQNRTGKKSPSSRLKT